MGRPMHRRYILEPDSWAWTQDAPEDGGTRDRQSDGQVLDQPNGRRREDVYPGNGRQGESSLFPKIELPNTRPTCSTNPKSGTKDKQTVGLARMTQRKPSPPIWTINATRKQDFSLQSVETRQQRQRLTSGLLQRAQSMVNLADRSSKTPDSRTTSSSNNFLPEWNRSPMSTEMDSASAGFPCPGLSESSSTMSSPSYASSTSYLHEFNPSVASSLTASSSAPSSFEDFYLQEENPSEVSSSVSSSQISRHERPKYQINLNCKHFTYLNSSRTDSPPDLSEVCRSLTSLSRDMPRPMEKLSCSLNQENHDSNQVRNVQVTTQRKQDSKHTKHVTVTFEIASDSDPSSSDDMNVTLLAGNVSNGKGKRFLKRKNQTTDIREPDPVCHEETPNVTADTEQEEEFVDNENTGPEEVYSPDFEGNEDVTATPQELEDHRDTEETNTAPKAEAQREHGCDVEEPQTPNEHPCSETCHQEEGQATVAADEDESDDDKDSGHGNEVSDYDDDSTLMLGGQEDARAEVKASRHTLLPRREPLKNQQREKFTPSSGNSDTTPKPKPKIPAKIYNFDLQMHVVHSFKNSGRIYSMPGGDYVQIPGRQVRGYVQFPRTSGDKFIEYGVESSTFDFDNSAIDFLPLKMPFVPETNSCVPCQLPDIVESHRPLQALVSAFLGARSGYKQDWCVLQEVVDLRTSFDVNNCLYLSEIAKQGYNLGGDINMKFQIKLLRQNQEHGNGDETSPDTIENQNIQ